MPTDEAFASAFKDVDLVVVIDDWKTPTERTEPEPCYFAARTFNADDPSTKRVYEVLQSAGAANWHASGNRKDHGFLFDSPHFETIFRWLNSARTRRYDMLMSVPALNDIEIRKKWLDVLTKHPELKPVWDVGDAHALGLFRFADFLGGRLAQELDAGTRVRFVCDRVSWISSRTSQIETVADGVALLGWGQRGIQAELLCIADKASAGASPYLPLLGLVDSETWAFGRLNSLRTQEGRSVRCHFLTWLETSASPDDDVLSEEEFEKALDVHRNHPHFLEYLTALKSWEGARSFALHEQTSADRRAV